MAGCMCGLSFTFVIIWIVHNSDGHPQCINSKSPFHTPTKLSFCKDYEQFGCCTPQNDTQLKNRFQRIKNLIPASEKSLWGHCSDFAKTFLCLKCSPYAAHIFEAKRSPENNVPIPKAFPALCGSYCSNFYNSCKDLVKYYMVEFGSAYIEETSRLKMTLNQNETAFCSNVSVSDMDYCYPDLLKNPILKGNVSIKKSTNEGCICVKPYGEHKFRIPVFLKHVKDGSNRLFIGETVGIVRIMYTDGTILPDPFLDIRADLGKTINTSDEIGMLGMAFHPNYVENRKFYIYYSMEQNYTERAKGKGNHKCRLEEFMVDRLNPNQADNKYRRVILEFFPPLENHNGGEILFGDDSYMYLFIGDGGGFGDPLQNAQNLYSMLGKVLRIDVDNVDLNRQKYYSIPPDNPFADTRKGLPEIYAYGIRNMWRCVKDRGDLVSGYGKGRIVCGDVGQGTVEEIDLIEKGANYGWNLKEGTADFCQTCNRAQPKLKLTEPIAQYTHDIGKCVIGGQFYRGCESTSLNGFYIYGDFMLGKIFRLTEPSDPKEKKWDNKELNMCGSDWCKPPLTNKYSTGITAFGEDAYGEVYMLSFQITCKGAFCGTVYKIVDPMRRGDVCKPVKKPKRTERSSNSNTIETKSGSGYFKFVSASSGAREALTFSCTCSLLCLFKMYYVTKYWVSASSLDPNSVFGPD